METSKLSTKGQIIVPKSIRDARAWKPGTELAFHVTNEGILIRPVNPFPRTTLEQVAGCLKYSGKPKTLEEMEKGIEKEIRRRHARGRY